MRGDQRLATQAGAWAFPFLTAWLRAPRPPQVHQRIQKHLAATSPHLVEVVWTKCVGAGGRRGWLGRESRASTQRAGPCSDTACRRRSERPHLASPPSPGWRPSAWSAGGAWRASWRPATRAWSCSRRWRSCAAGSGPRGSTDGSALHKGIGMCPFLWSINNCNQAAQRLDFAHVHSSPRGHRHMALTMRQGVEKVHAPLHTQNPLHSSLAYCRGQGDHGNPSTSCSRL